MATAAVVVVVSCKQISNRARGNAIMKSFILLLIQLHLKPTNDDEGLFIEGNKYQILDQGWCVCVCVEKF